MPIYEYECEKCKQHTEALQKTDDPPLETCEQCGGKLQKTSPNSTLRMISSLTSFLSALRSSTIPVSGCTSPLMVQAFT